MATPKQSNGFVLFIVMVYLQLFSLLSMQMLTGLIEVTKGTQTLRQQYQNRLRAMLIMNQLDHLSPVSCVRKPVSSHFLKYQTEKWWNRDGCALPDEYGRSFYRREVVLRGVCADINDRGLQPVIFYRTSMYLPVDPPLVLQDVVVVVNETDSGCQESIGRLAIGRQSMRWVF